MANRRTSAKRPSPPAVAVPEINDPLVKAVSLRVPDSLHTQAKICAEACGIPVNGLICIALAEFLSERGYGVYPSTLAKRS